MIRRPPVRALRPALTTLCVIAALTACLGCVRVGAGRVYHDRFDYNMAIARTQDEQMLLNLVRLRYFDTPTFLQVGSVATQYSVEGTASASAGLNEAGPNSLGLEAGATYSESPTVTYVPLSGDQFARQLLTPIPFESVFLLTRSGWSVERVLRCCVEGLNELPNAPTASGPTPVGEPEYADFARVAAMLRELQLDRALKIEVDHAGGRGRILLQFDEQRATSRAAELKRLLGVPENARALRLASRDTATTDDDLRVATRSLMGVLFFLSQSVQPAPADLAAGRVRATRSTDGEDFDWDRVLGGLFKVHVSAERPAEAFVAVRYRGAWFYIADDDLETKSTFGLLTQLFSLQAGQGAAVTPMLTLPVG